jgi:hypothetical protein
VTKSGRGTGRREAGEEKTVIEYTYKGRRVTILLIDLEPHPEYFSGDEGDFAPFVEILFEDGEVAEVNPDDVIPNPIHILKYGYGREPE